MYRLIIVNAVPSATLIIEKITIRSVWVLISTFIQLKKEYQKCLKIVQF